MIELDFDAEEQYANGLLLKFMEQLKAWNLNCNENEWVHAIHTLQMFVIKHMLQRLDAKDFSHWYDTP